MQLEQILQGHKSKPDSDIILDIYYALASRNLVSSWDDFLNQNIPWIFEMLERIRKENENYEKGMKRGRI